VTRINFRVEHFSRSIQNQNMATTLTSTDAPIELQQPSQERIESVRDEVQSEDIVETSRLVDAGVPEGGYGWVVLASCGTFKDHKPTSCLTFLADSMQKELSAGGLLALHIAGVRKSQHES
jgi:hypothetical protein